MQLKEHIKSLFGHRILVLLDSVKSDLELPDKRQYDPNVGTVVLVGDGLNTMAIRTYAIPLSVGDRVVMSDQGFEPITVAENPGTFRLCHGDDVLGQL